MALKQHSFFIRFLAVLLVIFVVLGVAIVVILNLTLSQLGLSDKQITQDYTVESLGISYVKVGQVVSILQSISTKQNLEEIAPNAYTAEHKTSADVKFDNTSIGILNDTPDYQKLLFTSAVIVRPLTFKFPEVAYTLSTALQQFYASEGGQLASEYIQAVEVLKRLNAHFSELSFFTQEGKLYLKSVISLDVSEYTADINSQISFFQITDKVYCTLVNEVEVTNKSLLGLVERKGVLAQKQFVSVAVNKLETALSEKALNALFMLTAKEGETQLSVNMINQSVCALISDFLSHIGGIGVANGLTDYQYGVQGIDCAKNEVTFLPQVV